MNKKTYNSPSINIVIINTQSHFLAGSTGNVENVGISSTEEITTGSEFGSRGGFFEDDEDY